MNPRPNGTGIQELQCNQYRHRLALLIRNIIGSRFDGLT
jgi:hypothetical protein